MDVKDIIILFAVISITFADYPVFPCLVEKNRYYHKQLNRCRLCDRCLTGEGADLTAEVEVIERFGALKCRPCIKCKPGTYNSRRAFKCKPCKDCAASGRTVKTACAPDRNEVCGKRIKSEPNTTPEPTTILPTQHPPPRDHRHDHETNTNVQNDGHTVLNNHTHINVSALGVSSVILAIATIAVLGILYKKCFPGKRGCSLRSTNHIGDLQPIPVSGYNTPSLVSEVHPTTSRLKQPTYGIKNNVCTATDHQDDDKNTPGDSYRENGHSQRSFHQITDLSPLADNRSHIHYTPIRQEEYSPNGNMQYTGRLSSDVEEDAAPPFMVTNEISTSTGGVNSTSSITEPTVPSNSLTPSNHLYHELAASNMQNDSKLTDREQHQLNRTELETFIKQASKYLGPNENYQKLGRHLSVSTTDIDIIKEEHSRLQERAYRTMRKWMECDPTATVDVLKTAICEIGKKDIVDKLQTNQS